MRLVIERAIRLREFGLFQSRPARGSANWGGIRTTRNGPPNTRAAKSRSFVGVGNLTSTNPSPRGYDSTEDSIIQVDSSSRVLMAPYHLVGPSRRDQYSVGLDHYRAPTEPETSHEQVTPLNLCHCLVVPRLVRTGDGPTPLWDRTSKQTKRGSITRPCSSPVVHLPGAQPPLRDRAQGLFDLCLVLTDIDPGSESRRSDVRDGTDTRLPSCFAVTDPGC